MGTTGFGTSGLDSVGVSWKADNEGGGANTMTFTTSRMIPSPPERVFAAFEDGVRLAAWWGPAGFTNTFRTFDFRAGGKWSFTMHGPDGKAYENESMFEEIDPPGRIVIHHLSKPRFLLTITLEPTADGGTDVGWVQEFENPEIARGIERIVVPANEQNLDRLSAEVFSVE